ncbi:MAG: HAMP domain-containing histidine kinase [Actinobacteria bacterium]|nr:MAG: HAMP domain-containing histidine kinase [Actinomycetota bacterium]
MRRPSSLELGWGAFAVANLAAMVVWQSWETVPFHFIWVSLTLLYGFRVWRVGPMLGVLGFVVVSTGAFIFWDIHLGTQLWGELTEVPLMSAMFLAMVWHARRRQAALREVEELADARATLLASQEQFLHDASHELRTPVTIARGHLEVLRRSGTSAGEIDVALDELGRIERIVERLLLLAKADRPDFLVPTEIELEACLEDVFMRFAEVAPRRWRLGDLAAGTLVADAEQLRFALDALLENAVKHTEPGDAIELRSQAVAGGVSIEVADSGSGIPQDAFGRIFERFGRADSARNRAVDGVGLGLSIVDAIVRAHGGTCSVSTDGDGSTFVLTLPGFRPAAEAPQSTSLRVIA